MRKTSDAPLAIDLFCGLGGWTEGLLAEGFRVVGFDNERHAYGDERYPAQMVIQDVLTIHGAQFKDAALIVASPPCQAYSYRAMPWKRAKALPPPDNSLFDACFRIQAEAIAAAGHFIPLVVENVCGAQKWVGRARYHFGSFYLWGDVPALMPVIKRAIKGRGGPWFKDANTADGTYGPGNFRIGVDGVKVESVIGRRTDVGKGARFTSRDCGLEASGIKQHGSGREWFAGDGKISRLTSSRSPARKCASAMIAKIPFSLARHIARAWKPEEK